MQARAAASHIRATRNGAPADVGERLLDAAQRCVAVWGFGRVTVDDIAHEAGVSRATLYRVFPGGRDVLFEALRVRERNAFFDVLTAETSEVDDLEELVVRLVVRATHELRTDHHLALMLAAEPGQTLDELTVSGMPRIIETASEYLVPVLAPYLDPAVVPMAVEILVRLTVSYFLAPSDLVDLGDPVSARSFLAPGLAALCLSSAPDRNTTNPSEQP